MCVGPAGGQEPIKSISRVLICRKRGAVFGKRLTFMRNSPYEQVKCNVLGRYVKHFLVLGKNINTIISVIESLKV